MSNQQQEPRANGTGKPTLRDLAAAAGVSFSLASIVMRDAPGASESTRARVKRVAEEIGYRPNLAARFLRRGRSRLIGVSYRLNSPYLADVVRSIYAAAGAAGYDVVLGGWYDTDSERKAASTLVGYRSAALILVGPTLPSTDLAQLAEQEPIVTLYVRKSLPSADSVITNEHLGMRLLVDYLVGIGHRAIAHVDGGAAVVSEARRVGYRHAMEAHGLGEQVRIVPGGETLEAGVAAADRLAPEAGAHTAITAFNDDCAHGLIDRLESLGIAVPGNLSVTGFDGGRYSTFLPHHLTTVRQDHERYAQLSVQRVIERLEHGAEGGQHAVVEPSLVIGRSTRPVVVKAGSTPAA